MAQSSQQRICALRRGPLAPIIARFTYLDELERDLTDAESDEWKALDDEIYNRKMDESEPIDYDEQDRRAASEERVELQRMER